MIGVLGVKINSVSMPAHASEASFTAKRFILRKKKKQQQQYSCNKKGHKTNYINLCLSIDFIQTSLHFVDNGCHEFFTSKNFRIFDSLFIRNELMIIFILPLVTGHELCIFQLLAFKQSFLSYFVFEG